jgi:hypothetical protein
MRKRPFPWRMNFFNSARIKAVMAGGHDGFYAADAEN